MHRLLSLFILVTFMNPLAAQAQKYSTWSDPNQPAQTTGTATGKGTVQDLLDQLNKLVDEAEKSRAADPAFLRDLRDLARNYDNPWRNQILSDDFFDGDFTSNPVWTVSAGRYWIEKGWGLRSSINPGAKTQTTQEAPAKKLDGQDAVIAILGAVLKQSQKSKTREPEPAEPTEAIIYSQARISNAFSIEVELSSWQAAGRLDFGPFQGKTPTSGYRLSYSPGGQLSLLRVSSRGTSIVDTTRETVTLEDKKPHVLLWTRDEAGRMKVSVDGKLVLETADRGFRDPFQGLTFINRGGDYILKRVLVNGAG